MSDEELIARLREGCSCNIHKTPCWAETECRDYFAAADRIEALTEQLAAAQHDAKEAEAYAEELEAKLATCEKYRDAYAECDRTGTQAVRDLEAKLAKAVGLVLEECPFRHGTPKYNDWWHHRRATLAELKGVKDE